MTTALRVHLLPALTSPDELAGKLVVVIDVLRATTTIAAALAAGAQRVIPCLEVDEAQELAKDMRRGAQKGRVAAASALQAGRMSDGTTPGGVLLGGERDGLKIPGFDLGNSPEEYTRDRVAGRTILFTTTNGTRAMMACRAAHRVLLAAFVNFSAVYNEVARGAADHPERGIELLCAGTRGEVTREDVLLAGALADELSRQFSGPLETNDQADIAADAWRTAAARMQSGEPLAEILRHSQGGRNAIERGQERDIEIAAQIDRLDVVAVLDVESWSIRRQG